jgi:hypothetical protein
VNANRPSGVTDTGASLTTPIPEPERIKSHLQHETSSLRGGPDDRSRCLAARIREVRERGAREFGDAKLLPGLSRWQGLRKQLYRPGPDVPPTARLRLRRLKCTRCLGL